MMGRKPSLDKWITSKEAARKLECTSANIWMMIQAGKVPGAQLCGGVYMIPVDSLTTAARYRRKRYRTKKTAA